MCINIYTAWRGKSNSSTDNRKLWTHVILYENKRGYTGALEIPLFFSGLSLSRS